MPLSPDRLPDAYRQMLVIRKFEETVRNLYQQGKIRGSFHPCVGQEAVSVGACWALRQDDYLTCTYRGHGHSLAKGLSVRAAMAIVEIARHLEGDQRLRSAALLALPEGRAATA